MSVPVRRHATSVRFPDLLDWLESPWSALVPFGQAQIFRVEDYTEDGRYMIRAELPGLDPKQDVDVTVDAGALTIHAERREESKQEHHSEFRYGSLTRTVSLPEGADAEHISATYDKGILEITVPVPERAKPGARRIAIQQAG